MGLRVLIDKIFLTPFDQIFGVIRKIDVLVSEYYFNYQI